MKGATLQPRFTGAFRRASDPATAAGRAAILRARNHVREIGSAERIRELEQTRPLTSLGHWLGAWAIVGGACALVLAGSVWFLPLALVLIGSRQRAFGNILHDFVHGNVVRQPGALLRVIAAAPAFESYARYRMLHMQHHTHVGDPELDPDYFGVEVTATSTAWTVFWDVALRPRMFVSSVLGDLHNLSAGAVARVALFWAVLLAPVAVLAGPAAAVAACGIWILARATTYHALKCFAELGDHYGGLSPDSLFTYARVYPRTLLSHLLHPYNDPYHLTHHLFPRVTMLNLGHVHELLQELDEYRAVDVYDGYFLGASSVARSFLGTAAGAAETAARGDAAAVVEQP